MAYHFYLDGMELPVTPSELSIQTDSRNQSLDLMNAGEINILKSPALKKIQFDMLLPHVRYPFSNRYRSAETVLKRLEQLADGKKPFRFLVTRSAPNKELLFDTNLKVALDGYSVKESADNGSDVVVSVTLKQYVSYGTRTINVKSSGEAVTNVKREGKNPAKSHVVKAGDCLWALTQQYWGDGSRYREVYLKNKSVIDAGNRGTGNPIYTIYPGQVLQFG